MTSSGYTIDLAQTESVADSMNDMASYPDAATSNCRSIDKLPAPAAGESVGLQLSAFQTAWEAIFKDLKTEMGALASKAHGTVTIHEKVNSHTAAMINKMRQFEN